MTASVVETSVRHSGRCPVCLRDVSMTSRFQQDVGEGSLEDALARLERAVEAYLPDLREHRKACAPVVPLAPETSR